MKKFFTLAFSTAMLFAAQAQVAFYTQTFNTFPPPLWSNVDNTGTNAGTWARTTVSGPGFTTRTNGYALFNSYGFGNDGKPEDASLISGPISCSGFNYIELEFQSWFIQNSASQGTVSVSTDNSNWLPVYAVSTTTAGSVDKIKLDISAIAANSPSVYLKFEYTGDYDYYWAVDDIKLISLPSLDISVDTLTIEKYVPMGYQTVKGVITNNGGLPVTSFDISYTDNGGTPVFQSFSNQNILPLQKFNFSFDQRILMDSAISHNLVVTTYAPNTGTDLVASNDKRTQKVYALSAIPVKNVLLEEFTTTSCVYCPDGATRLNGIMARNTNLILADIHAGFGTDDMTVNPDEPALASAYTDFAPAVMVDRTYYESETGTNIAYYTGVDRWEPYALARKLAPTPVAIFADNTFDSASRVLTVNASAVFYSTIKDNFRINCYIVEDSVSGGSTYNQSNGSSNDPTSEWYHRGNPIVGYKHRHVIRQLLGGAWGSTGVIDSTTANRQAYTKQYTYTFPSTWRVSQIKLVAFVQHYASNKFDRQIANALEFDLNSSDSTGATDVVIDTTTSSVKDINGSLLNSISLFPNPASDVLNIDFSLSSNSNFGFEVYDMIGHLITNSPSANLAKGDYQTAVNTADFNNGVYFIAVKDGNKVVRTLKFVVSK